MLKKKKVILRKGRRTVWLVVIATEIDICHFQQRQGENVWRRALGNERQYEELLMVID